MVENHNPDHNESKPLTTETEVLAPEATADIDGLSSTSTNNHDHVTPSEDPASGQLAESLSAATEAANRS